MTNNQKPEEYRVIRLKCPPHDFGYTAIGGFPGHEHIHPTGVQVCFKCRKTCGELEKEAYLNGFHDGVDHHCTFKPKNGDYKHLVCSDLRCIKTTGGEK